MTRQNNKSSGEFFCCSVIGYRKPLPTKQRNYFMGRKRENKHSFVISLSGIECYNSSNKVSRSYNG